MIVHYAVMSCQMDDIMVLAKKFKLKIIEDASHAWGAYFKDKLLGTIGDIGCFSLHSTKNITSGEGGVFITNSREIFERAEVYRQYGTNRYHFLEGKVDQYQWTSIGSSYYLSGLQSAIAQAQLKKLDKINRKRTKIARMYLKLLSDVSEIILPKVPSKCQPNWHIFAILVSKNKGGDLRKFLKSKGIEASFHYFPLHASIMGKKLGYKANDFEVSSKVAASLLRLPIYPGLTDQQIQYITENIRHFFKM